MPTLYNQYIYRDGAWRQTGTSSDSVTYQISFSNNVLTLTGSDGSTSSVTISSQSPATEEIYYVELMGTVNWAEVVQAVEDGKIIVMVARDDEDGDNDYGFATSVKIDPDNPQGVVTSNYMTCGLFYVVGTTVQAIHVEWNPVDGWSMTRATIPPPSTTTPLMDGTAAVGTESKYARGDHVHPSDTSKVSTSTTINGKALSSNITLTASDVGALPDTTEIPEKTSDLTNDSNFVSDANYVHTDNNFTDTLEAKLNGIAEGATVDDKTWNGVTLAKQQATIVGDAGYVPIVNSVTPQVASFTPIKNTPTANVIAKYDNSSYLNSTTPTAGDSSTKVATTAFVSDAIGTAISGVNSFEYEVVQSLPTTNIKDHTIYLVAKTGSTGDVYDEYLYINNSWEHIGSTDVDLSGYVPTTRKVNNKALSSDITLTASDVGATDEKLKTEVYSNDATFTAYPILTTFSSQAETKKFDSTMYYTSRQDEESARLTIGRSGFRKGQLVLEGKNGSYAILQPPSTNSGHYVTLPDTSGTIALTSNIPSASSTTPIMDGTAAVGTETTFAKGDHVHPSDTSKVSTSTTINGKALSSNITLDASDVGALPDSTVIPAQTAKIWTGRCTATSGTATKIITLDDPTGFSLTAGVRILVYFENNYIGTTTPKLNVNNTGEESVWMGTSDGQSSNNNLIKWANYESVLFTCRGEGNGWTFEGSGSSLDTIDTDKVSKSGDTMKGALTFNRQQNSNSKIVLRYDSDSATMISPIGYEGTATNNTPIIEFMSTHANSSGSSNYNTILRRIATPSNNNDAANKLYVDTAISNIDALPSQTGNSGKFLTTNGTTASWSEVESDVFVAIPYETTYADLLDAVTNEKSIIVSISEDTELLQVIKAYYQPMYNYVMLWGIYIGGNLSSPSMTLERYDIYSNNTWENYSYNIPREVDLETKQDKYTITTATISASGWSNAVYSALQTTYPAASYDIEIELNGDLVTSEQKDAWSAAQIVGSATGNTIKALGDVPAVDIPVIVKATPTTDTSTI